MCYIIYIIFMILFFVTSHLKNAYLLIDAENNAGQMVARLNEVTPGTLPESVLTHLVRATR